MIYYMCDNAIYFGRVTQILTHSLTYGIQYSTAEFREFENYAHLEGLWFYHLIPDITLL